MGLGVDGNQIEMYTLDYGDNSWQTVTVSIKLEPGLHTVDVWFLNDGVVDGQDRNLEFQWVQIENPNF